jgi:hypothetical protein
VCVCMCMQISMDVCGYVDGSVYVGEFQRRQLDLGNNCHSGIYLMCEGIPFWGQNIG